MTEIGAFKGVCELASFKRSRNPKVKNMVSKYPTNVRLSATFVRDRLGHHGPKRSGVAAPHGRSSRMRFLSNVCRKGAAKAPVNFIV